MGSRVVKRSRVLHLGLRNLLFKFRIEQKLLKSDLIGAMQSEQMNKLSNKRPTSKKHWGKREKVCIHHLHLTPAKLHVGTIVKKLFWCKWGWKKHTQKKINLDNKLMALRLFPDRLLPERRFPEFSYPDQHRDISFPDRFIEIFERLKIALIFRGMVKDKVGETNILCPGRENCRCLCYGRGFLLWSGKL